MSTPCAKYATRGEVAQIKSSIRQTQQQNRDQISKYGDVRVLGNQGSVSIGDVNYGVSTNKTQIQQVIDAQAASTKEMRDRKSAARSELPKEDRDALKKQESLRSALSGSVGEQIAANAVGKVLGYKPIAFDKPGGGQGFDGVFRTPDGRLALIEAKNTQDPKGNGQASLSKYRAGDKEMDDSAIMRQASYMTDPLTMHGSLRNAVIGQEILDKGASNIEKLLVYTDPSTLNTVISRWDGNVWDPVALLQPDFNDLSNL